MDNQHRKISGYRELSQEEIDIMNAIKEKEKEVKELIGELSSFNEIDQEWFHEGKMDVQKGFMSLVRSIAKPN